MITLTEATDKVAKIDLGPIRFKLLQNEDGTTRISEQILQAEIAYRQFLTVCLMRPGVPIVPTKDIDTMWHTHILDTRKYAEDCDALFGEFLHHFPYLGLRDDSDAENLKKIFTETKVIFHNLFGEQSCLVSGNAANCDTDSDGSCKANDCAPDHGEFTERPTVSVSKLEEMAAH